MALTDKQVGKIKKILEPTGLVDADNLLTEAKLDPSIRNLKVARKAIKGQLKIVDKALLICDIDLAFDEAKALIEKKE